MIEQYEKPRKINPPSSAQQWTRKRYWNRTKVMRILGTIVNLQYDNLTVEYERKEFVVAEAALRRIIWQWNNNSKQSKQQFLGGKRCQVQKT